MWRRWGWWPGSGSWEEVFHNSHTHDKGHLYQGYWCITAAAATHIETNTTQWHQTNPYWPPDLTNLPWH